MHEVQIGRALERGSPLFPNPTPPHCCPQMLMLHLGALVASLSAVIGSAGPHELSRYTIEQRTPNAPHAERQVIETCAGSLVFSRCPDGITCAPPGYTCCGCMSDPCPAVLANKHQSPAHVTPPRPASTGRDAVPPLWTPRNAEGVRPSPDLELADTSFLVTHG